MIVGVPKEIKDCEFRVGIVPSGVKTLTDKGARVLIQESAGEGSGITDEDFIAAGAEIVGTAHEAYESADLVIKVKEPQSSEYQYFREGLILYCFFHLAGDPALAHALVESKVTAIAYETLAEEGHGVPILKPMSEVAGRLSVQIGAHYLMKTHGGEGVLLSGVPGVEKGRIVIIGAGTVGENAIKSAVGMGADVTVLDIDPERFRYLDDLFGGQITTLVSNTMNVEKAVLGADLLIGATHVPGARTERLISEELVKKMKKGSVIVDVSVDQGGCVETIRPTTHSEPTYELHGVIHYGVSNMPGVVPRTSTYALTNATLPYLLVLSEHGLAGALVEKPSIKTGINAHKGHITHQAAAEAVGLPYVTLDSLT